MIKIDDTKISNIIFQKVDIPNITSEGIAVMNVIGITVLKSTLNGNENEFKGNLPTYRNERSTSVAFHVFTNHIVVVEIKNQRL